MNFNGKAMVAVAMMLGSMATIGCKGQEQAAPQESAPAPVVVAAPEAPAAEVAPAKATDEGVNVKASVKVNTRAPAAPAERYENPGRAPSRDHSWIKGHWRHEGQRGYQWTPGRWIVQFAPSAPPAPRYENPGRPISNDHVWVSGHWQRTGRDWTWVGGHWSHRRQNQNYVAPRWERQQSRYVYVPGRWVRR